jgi:chemotaxis protein CheX
MRSPISSTANTEGPLLEQWREQLSDAAKHVFSTMLGTEITLPDESDLVVVADVTAIIGLAGQLCGVLTVRCSASTGSRIASCMLGVPIEEASANQCDAVAEVCNMVAGNFKAKIGMEDKCMLSVPTVITGCDYQFHSLVSGSRVEVPMIFDGQVVWFTLEIRGQ